jgi:hypothetical protein
MPLERASRSVLLALTLFAAAPTSGSGLAVRQTSHAGVAGSVFDANGAQGINLADSAMRLFERPNTTTTPNGSFGIPTASWALIWMARSEV